MNLLIFFIILSILIVVHEFGHFIAAKKSKIRVEVFSLGFGKKLFSRKLKDTEYMISALPFGGYIKMAGDNTQEAKGAVDEFLSASLLKRFCVIFFGPLFNYLLGIVFFWIVFVIGFVQLPTTVDTVCDNSGAKAAGIIAGDRITSVEGSSVQYWDDLVRQVYRNRSRDIVWVGVDRAGQPLSFAVHLKYTQMTETGPKARVGLGVTACSNKAIVVKTNVAQALVLSAKHTYDLTVLTYQALWSMVTGSLSVKDSVTGPLGMFVITDKVIKLGIAAVLNFVAILSISLGIFNLLPLPALDGGHLVLLLVEKIRGKPLSKKADEVLNQIGFGFLILAAVLVFFNDLVKFGFVRKFLDLCQKFQAIFHRFIQK